MPDWNCFRSALLKGDSRAEALLRIVEIQAWLDRPEDGTLAPLMEKWAPTGRDTAREREGELRSYWALVSVVRLKMARDAGGAPGEGLQERLSKTFRLQAEIVKAGGGPLAESRVRQQMLAISARAELPFHPAVAAPEQIAELERVIADYEAVGAHAEAGDPGLADLWWMTGSAASELARRHQQLGRHDDERRWLERAAELFERGNDGRAADDCRARSRDLDRRLAGDLDQQLASALGTLAAGVAAEPAARAAALVKLVREYSAAGDGFEAMRTAEAAAAALEELVPPLKDPLRVEMDEAVDSWIAAAATASASGTEFLRRFHEAMGSYFTLLGAHVSGSPDGGKAARRLDELKRLFEEVAAGVAAVEAEVPRVYALYFPDDAPVAPAAGAGAPDAGPSLDAELAAMDDALLAVRLECNRRVEEGRPMEDLLDLVEQLRQRARALRVPLYETKALLQRVYVTLRLGRLPEMLAAAEEATATLLAGRPATLGSLAQSFERRMYLEARYHAFMARAMMGELAQALAVCEETVSDVESQRYRVNTPFQQSAFLSSVVGFYRHGALTAFKLQRWDTMIDLMESVKARAAVRGRLAQAAPPQSLSDLEKQLEDTSKALAAAVEERGFQRNDATEITKDLAARRRWLWDLLAIARGRAAHAALPELRLANLQAALDPDEAAIGYLWLDPQVLLVVLFDRERFHAQRIVLEPGQRRRLSRLVTMIQEMRGAMLSLDQVFEPLGEVLFPAFCREFVAGKRRLVVSPNHALHLFPFHAVRWDGEFLGTRFAVRYVPSFSSLLVPWRGAGEDRVLAVGLCHSGVGGCVDLPEAEAEVREIRAGYEARGVSVDTLTGDEVSRETLERMRDAGQLARYRVVHLATHAESVFASASDPLEARLVLHRSYLDSMDIAALGMEAEVVVLSACHTGQRAIGRGAMDELPGDDIFGIQSALFQSGVRVVMGSLWPVESGSAAAIVTAFHRGLAAGDLPEVALQSAVRGYLAQAKHPSMYFWAPFFLTSLGTRAPARDTPPEN